MRCRIENYDYPLTNYNPYMDIELPIEPDVAPPDLAWKRDYLEDEEEDDN